MKEEAVKRGENAAHGGRHDDGGKGAMLEQLQAFDDGIRFSTNGIYPVWLKPYVDQVKIQEDPEYNEYIRLKEKFE